MPHPRLCPICKRALPEGAVAAFRPFCSKRCADIDLGRWLKGAYAIPASETDDAESDKGEAEIDEENGTNGPHRH
jgi:uncharacterized protein